MARVSSLARLVPAGVATLLALGVLAAPTGASADFNLPKCFPNCGKAPQYKLYPPKYGFGGPKHGSGWGYGAAALGGMAVGLVAAGAASAGAGPDAGYAGECYLVRRRAIDEDGNVYIRRVRVCE